MRALAALLLCLVPALGCGSSAGDCDKACRNYYDLHYWEAADQEIALAPMAEREALRTKKLGELEERRGKGLNLCIKQCTTASSKERVACLIAATSTADTKACPAD